MVGILDFFLYRYNEFVKAIVIPPFIILFLIFYVSHFMMAKPIQETNNYVTLFVILWFCFCLPFGIVLRITAERKGYDIEPYPFVPDSSVLFRPFNNRSREHHRKKQHKWTSLRGTAFELWLEELYRGRGYEVRHTGGQRDHDADLVLEKYGRKIVVQAKGYKNTVRKDAVNEAHAAKSIYDADEAWVVTNSYFTEYAREHAHGCQVKLYDRNDLDRYLRTGRQYQGHRRK